MAGFGALKFLFDNTLSTDYDMFIVDINGGGVTDGLGGDGTELITDSVYRKSKPYLYGTTQSTQLEFDLTFASSKQIDRIQLAKIQRWLFGKRNYSKLQILQCDLDTVYFNCFLLNPTVTSVGNMPYSFTCKVVCDAPWAWEFPKRKTFSSSLFETDVVFYNDSDNTDYMYPYNEFTLNALTSSLKVVNYSDNGRIAEFVNLVPNETITLDNQKQIITSSTGLNRLGNFNKNWFRLVSGVNKLRIVGGLEASTMTYQNARKVGS